MEGLVAISDNSLSVYRELKKPSFSLSYTETERLKTMHIQKTPL